MDHEVVTRLTDLLHGAARSAGVRKAAVTLVSRHPGILLPVLVQAAADPRGREQADAVRIVGDWMKSQPSVSNLGLLFGLLPDGSPQVCTIVACGGLQFDAFDPAQVPEWENASRSNS